MTADIAEEAIISQMLIAATTEMGAKLMRSAFSPILREARDGSAALLDRKGQVVAQAELIPIQLGSIGATMRACLEAHDIESIGEDDFLIANDPFHGGQHLHDIFLYRPVFFEARLIGFAATVAHHVDLGGATNALASDIWQEGLIIPPLKLSQSRDWNGGAFERVIRANCRLPEQVVGDLNAQFAAAATGARRLQDLCARHGVATIEAVMNSLMDYSERRVRAAIRAAPDGVYRGSAFIDDDGITDEPLEVQATVTIAGDEITVDFTGTCPQVQRNLNSPFASTVAAAHSCIKSVLTSADIPFNEGVGRPIKVTAPPGTLLNPRHPAPSRSRMQACYRAFNAVMQALSQAVPEKTIAQGFDTTTGILFAFQQEGAYGISVEVFGGGYGASQDRDGCDAVDSPLSNCSNTPIEAMDIAFAFIRVVGYQLEADSFGHGRRRGGAGFSRRYEVLSDGVTLTVFGDRFRHAPQGLFGGGAAQPGRCIIYRGGETISTAAKATHPLRRGDIVELHLGGGGGYGDPVLRERSLIQRDLDDGLLSEAAARVYLTGKS
jgi:N-methylhydantoinase B